MSEIKQFRENGFTVFKNLISLDTVHCLRNEAHKKIHNHSKELGISSSKYTFCTGRWLLEAPYNTEPLEEVNRTLLKYLEKKLNKKLSIKKINITCKNQFITSDVPLHQDISYSHSSPYDFTTWVALNDILINSGELIVVPNSQNFEIEPAVDFWSPDFIDENKKKYQNQITPIPLQQGDVVMFDSRLWHGSNKNLNGKDRYAYVIRWVIEDTQKSYHQNIPKPIPSRFGMWTCYDETKKILSNLLNKSLESTLEDLITETKIYIQSKKNPGYNREKALIDLEHLYVLHKAANLHNAGDLCGVIYKKLWHSFLKRISNNDNLS